MKKYKFKKAKAVWCKDVTHAYNQFAGFYTALEAEKNSEYTIAIAARAYYRIFINGEFLASGPARTAEGYCRVDQIRFQCDGKAHVAIEVLAVDRQEHYSNDCTMEPGLLTAEITDAIDEVVSATGGSSWKCRELPYRRMEAELMSHSRGITEYYDLSPQSREWMLGKDNVLDDTVVIEEPCYLERRTPYPGYKKIKMEQFLEAGDCRGKPEGETGTLYMLSRLVNARWYKNVPADNCFQKELLLEEDAKFSGKLTEDETREWISIKNGTRPGYLLWGNKVSELGFLEFEVELDKEGVIDLINSDHRGADGSARANTYASRFHLQPGRYHLYTWEPKLTRYIKLIFRTEGITRVKAPSVIQYTYDDKNRCYFECNDGDINRIYQASKRTLRLNTLDVFMDCPQRERGGWLCDSYFTARGAWQMLGDLSVEKDFIENFMLTDPDVCWNSFFPEVYPSCKSDPGEIGISNWSFWLAEELYDFSKRADDRGYIDSWRDRVCAFIKGVLSLRGESGLLENLPNQFIDWSLSNKKFNLEPISEAVNCLAVDMLEKMSELYGVSEWKNAADEMRGILENIPVNEFSMGDALEYKDGKFTRRGCMTESAIALGIWSGFHQSDKKYMHNFLKKMGTNPQYRANPNIGKSNLFIGLMIRLDVLSKLGHTEQLLEEIKDIYLPQLRMGSGTLFEGYHEFSGCHGFNAAIGSFMMSDVLGLGQPNQQEKTVKISPNPCGLLWASGAGQCEDGRIFMKWKADYEEHLLDMTVLVPQGWNMEVEFPFELTGWNITLNQQPI